MKTTPILFSAPMVRAILDGSKTQTRRVVKPCKDHFTGCNLAPCEIAGEINGERYENSKYIPDDQLWVKESFWGCDLPDYGDQPCVVYDDEWRGKEYIPAMPRPWARKFGRIPSIHMPRDCSRITLEITGVRVERLQDISEADARAEGIKRSQRAISPSEAMPCYWDYLRNEPQYRSARDSFASFWISINGLGSWDANPWVWVVEFKRVKP